MAPTKEDVAEAVCAWCHAWHTRDVQTMLAMEARAVGFGFRPFIWRDHVTRGEAHDRQALERFFGQLEVYSVVPEDFETAMTGDIAWHGGRFWSSGRRKDNRRNRPASASPRCSPRARRAGRWCCTTATSSLLLTRGATPRH